MVDLASRRLLIPLLALAACAVAACLLAPAADAGRKGKQVRVGFNNNAVTDRVATAPLAADLLHDVGADIDRVQISWKSLEPSPGEYRFSTYDAIYKADLERGVKPLFIFAYAPGWAAGGLCALVVSCHAPPTPAHYDDAARTAAVIADRYPKAAGIEIWNEPNTPYFWRPQPDPAAYTELLKASYTAIKAVDPRMRVAAGSFASGFAGSPGKIRGSHFLAAMYANGAEPYMDAISMHAYADPGYEQAQANIDDVRATRDRLGDPKTPLWVTETGISTTGSDGVSASAQASTLKELDRHLRKAPDVKMLLFHTLVEPPRGQASPETGYGLVEADLRKKLAYCTLGKRWNRPRACPSKSR